MENVFIQFNKDTKINRMYITKIARKDVSNYQDGNTSYMLGVSFGDNLYNEFHYHTEEQRDAVYAKF